MPCFGKCFKQENAVKSNISLPTIQGRRYEKDVPTDNSKLPDVAITGEHRFDWIGFTVIDGIRREFSLTQHFGEVRSKAGKWMKWWNDLMKSKGSMM